jgi:RNA polymerase sigma factor (sigma-70 family)
MALDSLDPGSSTSHIDVDPELVKNAQAYLKSGRHGRVLKGESTQGWEEFYHRCDLAIRRLAVSCGAQSIDDCTQEVWKTLIVKLAEFQSDPGRPPFCSWLHRLVRSKAVDQLRERNRHQTESLSVGAKEPVSKSDSDPAAEWERQSLRLQVHQVLGELEKQLPGQSYRILHMHWIEGRAMSEIASCLNLSIKQVWARHHRAKHKFRCLFERYVEKGFPPGLPTSTRSPTPDFPGSSTARESHGQGSRLDRAHHGFGRQVDVAVKDVVGVGRLLQE